MSQPNLILRSVVIRLPANAPMKKKSKGREIAGLVHACMACGWESAPVSGPAGWKRIPKHECPKARFEGPRDDQGAMLGPRFNYRENPNGGGR